MPSKIHDIIGNDIELVENKGKTASERKRTGNQNQKLAPVKHADTERGII